jgi:hypothetical protein
VNQNGPQHLDSLMAPAPGETPAPRCVADERTIVDVHVPLVLLGEADVIFDLLVGCNPANEQDIGESVLEQRLERRDAPGIRKPRGINHDRQHASPIEARVLELLPVVFGHANDPCSRERANWIRCEAADAHIKRREEVGGRDCGSATPAPGVANARHWRRHGKGRIPCLASVPQSNLRRDRYRREP